MIPIAGNHDETLRSYAGMQFGGPILRKRRSTSTATGVRPSPQASTCDRREAAEQGASFDWQAATGQFAAFAMR